jgi:hypothetical protein
MKLTAISIMKYGVFISLAMLYAGFALVDAALASEGEQRCEHRRTILQYLSNEYSEKPIAMGVAENGGLIEVLTSRHGNTFTIIVTSPDGNTCMVAAGEDWQALIKGAIPRT